MPAKNSGGREPKPTLIASQVDPPDEAERAKDQHWKKFAETIVSHEYFASLIVQMIRCPGLLSHG